MYSSITIPFGAKMLFNIIKLKPKVSMDDVEIALGEMCNVVKNTYGHGGGFIAGQVFEFAGFISQEGSTSNLDPHNDHIVIVTYWNSFEEHEKSHADHMFKEKFNKIVEMAIETTELGYSMNWQGIPE